MVPVAVLIASFLMRWKQQRYPSIIALERCQLHEITQHDDDGNASESIALGIVQRRICTASVVVHGTDGTTEHQTVGAAPKRLRL